MAKAKGSSGSAKRASKADDPVTLRPAEAGEGGASRPMLDLDFVRGLIDAVDGSGIDSLEITRAGTRVKISKTPPSGGVAPAYAAPPPGPAPASAPPPAQDPAAGAGDGAGGGGEAKLVEITSPMVGTFYRSPAPEAPSYVEVGSKVEKGQTLCIIEAMKLMNELESEASGVIREILVDNAEPVEYGQVLFRVDPTG